MSRPDSQKAKQVGGTHYATMPVTPFELGQANNYDPTLFTAIKYVLRFPEKGGEQDLEKAIHCLQIREEFAKTYGYPPRAVNRVPMEDALKANDIVGLHADCLRLLHMIGIGEFAHGSISEETETMINALEMLIETKYPKG